MATLPPPSAPEAWLRGAVAGIPPLLQPVAHALLQAQEDLVRALSPLTRDELHATPGGAASISYHVRHLVGSLDRLLTYAEDAQLSPAQRAGLASEAQPDERDADALLALSRAAIVDAMTRLQLLPEAELLEARTVGRLALPSTVLGLVFHAAEHTTRHVGQIITTAKVVRGSGDTLSTRRGEDA